MLYSDQHHGLAIPILETWYMIYAGIYCMMLVHVPFIIIMPSCISYTIYKYKKVDVFLYRSSHVFYKKKIVTYLLQHFSQIMSQLVWELSVVAVLCKHLEIRDITIEVRMWRGIEWNTSEFITEKSGISLKSIYIVSLDTKCQSRSTQ